MTTSFFAPPEAIRGAWVVLPEAEALHAARVLRKRPGDEIVVVDGNGGYYRVLLEQVDPRAAAGRVVETRWEVGEPKYTLTMGLALLKNPNRFETFLEKAVEAGVHHIVPLLTERTEKGRLKAQRARKILVAAMKQSGRSRLTSLADPQPLGAVLKREADLRLLCHEQAGPEQTLLAALSRRPTARRLSVLVGPEGGFSDEEVRLAAAAGYESVSLGSRRLRAETAALVAAAGVMLARAADSP